MKKLKCGSKISISMDGAWRDGVFKLKPAYPEHTRRNGKTGEVHIEFVEYGIVESLAHICRKLGFKLVSIHVREVRMSK